jgi:signal transduction histidine kinase
MRQKSQNLPALGTAPGTVVALVVADDFSTRGAVAEALKETTPSCEVLIAESLDQFRTILQDKMVDFVAFEISKIRPEGVLPLYETKLFAQSIGTIVIADSLHGSEFNSVMRSGCDRILLKRDGWLQELRGAIRQILRVRRLENENARLLGLLGAKNSELLEKNLRLDEYSATVAHDIRGLVSNVVMRIEFALESAQLKIPENLREQFQKAADTGRRVVEIVKSSYELAKLGIENQKFEKVALGSLIEEVRVDLGIDHDDSIELKTDQLPEVVCNKALLRRVFLNLFSNSIRYRSRGALKLEVRAQSSKDGRLMMITIADNGIGISPEKIKNIFKPYYRGSNSSAKSKGLGLGLAIVERIISLHGGAVTAQSELGVGSIFTIALPNDLSRQ